MANSYYVFITDARNGKTCDRKYLGDTLEVALKKLEEYLNDFSDSFIYHFAIVIKEGRGSVKT